MQFRSGNHLHRRGCSSQLLTLFIRLRNSSIEREGCSIYATSSLLINAGKRIFCKRNGNGFLCSCRQEYPLESAQAVIWNSTVCIALDIELNDFFRVPTALIFRRYNRNAVFIVQIRADNCSIGQPIAERIQNIFLPANTCRTASLPMPFRPPNPDTMLVSMLLFRVPDKLHCRLQLLEQLAFQLP